MITLPPATQPIGHEKELARLAAAVRARRPLLIYGPPDSGKTFLVQRFLRALPTEEQSCTVYVPGFVSVHALLEATARQLSGAAPSSARGSRAMARKFPRRLEASTSGRLRVLLRTMAQERRLCLFLDHFPRFSPFLMRLVNQLIWKDESSVYLLARGKTRDEIGYAWSIYFAPEYRLELGAFHEREAKSLLDQCVRQFGIASLASPEFRAEVLRRSAGLPGAIVKMCALAANPRYHYGNQVKLGLLHIDYLMHADPIHSLALSGPKR
jgi:AAA ATPase domain